MIVLPASAQGLRGFLLAGLLWCLLGAMPLGAAVPEITPVVDQEYLPALLALVAGASRSIDLVAYEFLDRSGPVGEIAAALILRKTTTASLSVRVFLEGDHGRLGKRNRATAHRLAAVGIQVFLDPRDITTHAKAVCVDDEVLLIGSTNLSGTSLTRNNETNLRIRSATLGKAFRTWFEAILADPGLPHPLAIRDGSVTLLADGEYRTAVRDLLGRAERDVQIMMYSCAYDGIPGSPISGLLELLAGLSPRVDVRLLLEQCDSFSPHVTADNRRTADFLRARGIGRILFDDPGRFSHAKVVVRDGNQVLIGSSNWFWRGEDLSHQVDVCVEDPTTARFFAGYIRQKALTQGVSPDDRPVAELWP